MSLRSFLQRINGSINIYQDITYPLQRHGNQHLMDIAHRSDKFTPIQLEYINRCRLYLQVCTVSDIANEAGTHLQTGALHGPPSTLFSSPNWTFPVQIKPHHQVWTYWLRLLDLIATPSNKLRQPLGPWKSPASSLARTWSEYQHKSGDTHYVQQITDDTKWLVLTRVRKTWHCTHFIQNPPLNELFPCALDSDLPTSLQLYPAPLILPIAATFHDFLCQQSPDIQKFLAHVTLLKDPFTIMDILHHSKIII